jgi:hypothetical protein
VPDEERVAARDADDARSLYRGTACAGTRGDRDRDQERKGPKQTTHDSQEA